MSSQLDFELDYFDIVSGLHDAGVRNVLHEMQHLNPDLFHEIESYFKFKEVDKKLGVLLDAGISGRTGSGMESTGVALTRPSSLTGTK